MVLGAFFVMIEIVAKPLLLLRLKNHPQDHQNHYQDHQDHPGARFMGCLLWVVNIFLMPNKRARARTRVLTDGQTDVQTDGQTDGRADGQTVRHADQ